MDLKEVINHIKIHHGKSSGDIANAIGTYGQNVWRWSTGETQKCSAEFARKIADTYGYDLDMVDEQWVFKKRSTPTYEIEKRTGEARENLKNYLKWSNGDIELAKIAEFIDQNDIPFDIIEEQITAQEELAKIINEQKKISDRLARVSRTISKFHQIFGRYTKDNDAAK